MLVVAFGWSNTSVVQSKDMSILYSLKNIIKVLAYIYLGDFMDENIVNTNQLYTSTLLAQDIYYLNIRYPFLNIQTIGNSVLV